MRLEDAIERFLSHTREHRSANTLRSYTSRLKPLRLMLGEREIESIRMADVDTFLTAAGRKADGSPKSADTRRANVIVVQTFFAFLVSFGFLGELPFKRLEKPRPRMRDRIPTEAEDAAIEKLASPEFLRVFRALRYCGARPGELSAATIADYRPAERLIVLSKHKTAEKTGKPRKIGVGKKLAAILTEAIGGRTEGPLFLAENGVAWTAQRLSKRYKRLCRQADLSEELCLYLQRHAHATELCEKLGVFAASQALGHTDVKTTQRYIKPKDSLLSEHQDLLDGEDEKETPEKGDGEEPQPS
jgi:site-specific recombinase XerD